VQEQCLKSDAEVDCLIDGILLHHGASEAV
jgi:hypothetical protein